MNGVNVCFNRLKAIAEQVSRKDEKPKPSSDATSANATGTMKWFLIFFWIKFLSR